MTGTWHWQCSEGFADRLNPSRLPSSQPTPSVKALHCANVVLQRPLLIAECPSKGYMRPGVLHSNSIKKECTLHHPLQHADDSLTS